MKRLPRQFFQTNPVECARNLIGCRLSIAGCIGKIIETEAYAATGDEACHTFSRPSARKFVTDHPAGTAYVYFNYGKHWMFNVLTKNTEPEGEGFVLFRAIEAYSGIQMMQRRRGTSDVNNLCSGPGKLTQAFGINGTFHGRSLLGGGDACFLERDATEGNPRIVSDSRIGISKAQNLQWRFLEKDNGLVSVPAMSDANGKSPGARGGNE